MYSLLVEKEFQINPLVFNNTQYIMFHNSPVNKMEKRAINPQSSVYRCISLILLHCYYFESSLVKCKIDRTQKQFQAKLQLNRIPSFH